MPSNRFHGQVKELESGLLLSGLFIKAYDKDLIFDDLIGTAYTGPNGEFTITVEITDYAKLFNTKPNLFFKIYHSDQQTLIYSCKAALSKKFNRDSELILLIPANKLHPSAKTEIVISGDNGIPKNVFSPGDNLIVQARGLKPITPYEWHVCTENELLFCCRYITDQIGNIEPTVLWPQIGLTDPHTNEPFSIPHAFDYWHNAKIDIQLKLENSVVASIQLQLNNLVPSPLVLCTNCNGRVLNGFEIENNDLFITLCHLPFSGAIRIYMVYRQFDWSEHDEFKPSMLANGQAAIIESNYSNLEPIKVIKLFDNKDLLPGAFDFIIRQIRYGFEEIDELRILRSDLIGSRHTTGVIVREPVRLAETISKSNLQRISISGRAHTSAPYFSFANTFSENENIYAAIEPTLEKNQTGSMCTLHIIKRKDASQWYKNHEITHLAPLDGNAAAIRIKTQYGGNNTNKILVWPGADSPGEYDVVADFSNQFRDGEKFNPNGKLDMSQRQINRYIGAAFRIVQDPGNMYTFAHYGQWRYDEKTIEASGFAGSVSVQDEIGSYADSTNAMLVNVLVPMKGIVCFPTHSSNIHDPAELSTEKTRYPLIMVVHGNGDCVDDYTFLLSHFARNGFIAAGIHLNANMRSLGRANTVLKHLPILMRLFGNRLENNIGLLGHCRSAEAIIKTARLNYEQNLGYHINALVSVAPTDQYGMETLESSFCNAFLILYGSRDGDIEGNKYTPGYTTPQSAFALYDRAQCNTKSMLFVYKATHNGFITTNRDAKPTDIPDLEQVTTQKNITKAYTNAFFRQTLLQDMRWCGIFKGDWVPSSVERSAAQIYVQYHENEDIPIANFNTNHMNWRTNSIYGSVSNQGTLQINPDDLIDARHPGQEKLKSPHISKGMILRWGNAHEKISFDLPPNLQDLSLFSHISFRAAQCTDSSYNLKNQPQNFRIALLDSNDNEFAIRLSAFATLPYPDHRINTMLTKTAMNTIRIPLCFFTVATEDNRHIDLKNCKCLSFIFCENNSGEIMIDNLVVTKN